MTREEAIEAIKCNWPDSRYTILREALDMAISALRQQEHFREVTKKVEPLTNAQKIRDMSDEELAELIDRETDSCAPTGDCEKMSRDCKACWLEWLKQPPREEANHENL